MCCLRWHQSRVGYFLALLIYVVKPHKTRCSRLAPYLGIRRTYCLTCFLFDNLGDLRDDFCCPTEPTVKCPSIWNQEPHFNLADVCLARDAGIIHLIVDAICHPPEQCPEFLCGQRARPFGAMENGLPGHCDFQDLARQWWLLSHLLGVLAFPKHRAELDETQRRRRSTGKGSRTLPSGTRSKVVPAPFDGGPSGFLGFADGFLVVLLRMPRPAAHLRRADN